MTTYYYFRNMGPNTRWLLEPDTSSGAVQSIDNYDITGDGVKDLIIGKVYKWYSFLYIHWKVSIWRFRVICHVHVLSYGVKFKGEIDIVQLIFIWCVVYLLEQKLPLHKKSWKSNERNLLTNTCFQKKCDLPNKSKLLIVKWYAIW